MTPAGLETVRTPCWLACAAAGLVGALLVVRRSDVFATPQFWHEDAVIFLTQQRTHGFLDSLLTPYAGYLHAYPRLVAAVTNTLPLLWTPTLYLAGACLAWIVSAMVIATSPAFVGIGSRLAAAVTLVAVPQGGEIFANLTNAQWPMAAALALLMVEPAGARRLTWQAPFVVIAGLTGPFSLLIAPLCVWRTWRRRTLPAPEALLLLTALIQGAVLTLSGSRLASTADISIANVASGLLLYVFPEFTGLKADSLGLTVAAGIRVAVTAICAALAISLLGRTRTNRPLLVGLAIFTFLSLLAGCLAGVTAGWIPSAFGEGQRYLYLPFVGFTWCMLLATPSAPPRLRWMGISLLMIAAVHSLLHFQAPRYAAAPWPEVARRVEAGESIVFRVAPLGAEVVLHPPVATAPTSPPAATTKPLQSAPPDR